MTTPIPAGWKLVPIEPTPEMIKAWHDTYSKAVIKTGRSNRAYAAMLRAAPGSPASVAPGDAQREAVMDALAKSLGSSAYFCTRVWHAWHVGTMSADDFVPIADVSDALADAADAMLAVLNAAPAAGDALDDTDRFRAAYMEWQEKTDFIQERLASGELPVKYLGWHRADVMRDLIDLASANSPVVEALDARRYRAIRNPPYSDRYGDLYAMTFQGDGDIPLKGDALDAAADAALAAQVPQQGEA